MFGPLENYGYVLNHGAILDYLPDATPDKYCPMIKNADGTEVQDKLVIMCKKSYLEVKLSSMIWKFCIPALAFNLKYPY